MWLPFRDLADDSERRAGAVGFGGIAGESLVGEVGIVLERAGRLDDVDALAGVLLSFGPFRQLAPPDRRVERAREVDPRQLAVGVVGGGSEAVQSTTRARAGRPARGRRGCRGRRGRWRRRRRPRDRLSYGLPVIAT